MLVAMPAAAMESGRLLRDRTLGETTYPLCKNSSSKPSSRTSSGRIVYTSSMRRG